MRVFLHPFRLLAIAFALLPVALDRKQRGKRLARALQKLGPAFIKLGQALSIRADLLGEDTARALACLQDKLPPFSTQEALSTIEQEFGKPVSELFAWFEDTPVAAASIAQVHFAETHEGKKVAVKILRPRIEERFARDIALFYWLARMSERFIPSSRRLKPVEIVRTLEDSVRKEMDLRLEAASASELREHMSSEPDFYVPEIYWPLTGRRVLTLERVYGIPLSDIDAVKQAGHDLTHLVEVAARVFFNQVFRDGFFHADMHPGNLFVGDKGQLIAVDFGIMGRLDKQTRLYLAEMLYGFLTRDYRLAAQAHFDAGYVPADQSLDDFALACRSIAEPILGQPLEQISLARLLAQLFHITAQFRMETQPQLLLLQKSMMLAEGVGRMLNPSVNMWQLSQPLIEEWMRAHLSIPARIRDMACDVFDLAKRLPRLHERLEAVLDRLEASA